MLTQQTIDKAKEYVRELFAGNAGGHGADHTLRVYANAMRLAQQVPGCDPAICALAALLHDADDHKLFQTENNANARAFLAANGAEAAETDYICRVIESVSFSKNRGRRPDTPEGCVVQDADRLDAIGAIGIARTFAYGGEHGRSIEASVQHFYDKLLLLKDMMNTEAARREAQARHAYMEGFLAQLNGEVSPWQD
jgi:uncharacterized protein